MGQRTNLLLQIEGRSGARLNKVYHLQWGYRKYLPMAFLHLLSGRYFKPEKKDVFQFCTETFELDGLTSIDKDWSEFNFNKLKDCQKVLDENESVCTYSTYKIGFLLGPEELEGEEPFCRWVTSVEFMKHQPRYDELYDNVFARAFDALTTASETEHLVTTVIG